MTNEFGNWSENTLKKKILIIIGTYLPGFKGGGHIRSIAGIVDYLGKDFEVYIICQDRDHGDLEPYKDIDCGHWIYVGDSKVMYLRHSQFSVPMYQSIYKILKPDILYLNTVFSFRETVLPLVLTMLLRVKTQVIIAPRGCLDPGALSLKKTKKYLFLRLFKFIQLHKFVIWHASTELEKSYIQGQFGSVKVQVAQNLPTMPKRSFDRRPTKKSGEVKMIFLSRITPKKNLLFLIDIFASISGSVNLTVAGPIEDPNYWNDFKSQIDGFEHVNLDYIGTVVHDKVFEVLSENHFFVLPTLGENFGHAIIEAFDAGLGVLISDETPWRNLNDYGVGWDIPLEDCDEWIKAVQACIDMEEEEFAVLSSKAKSIRNVFWDLDSVVADNVALFNSDNWKNNKNG